RSTRAAPAVAGVNDAGVEGVEGVVVGDRADGRSCTPAWRSPRKSPASRTKTRSNATPPAAHRIQGLNRKGSPSAAGEGGGAVGTRTGGGNGAVNPGAGGGRGVVGCGSSRSVPVSSACIGASSGAVVTWSGSLSVRRAVA